MYIVIRSTVLEPYGFAFQVGGTVYADEYDPDVIAELLFDGIIADEDDPRVAELSEGHDD